MSDFSLAFVVVIVLAVFAVANSLGPDVSPQTVQNDLTIPQSVSGGAAE